MKRAEMQKLKNKRHAWIIKSGSSDSWKCYIWAGSIYTKAAI